MHTLCIQLTKHFTFDCGIVIVIIYRYLNYEAGCLGISMDSFAAFMDIFNIVDLNLTRY
jgi:hypothetical protein